MGHPVPFLQFLVARDVLDHEQAAVIHERALRSNQLLGQLLLRGRHVTLRQMVDLLQRQAESPGKRLGELAIEAGYVTQDQLDGVLAKQTEAGGQHPLDQLMVSGLLAPAALVELLIAYVKLIDASSASAPV
jgi:hypothetical protein